MNDFETWLASAPLEGGVRICSNPRAFVIPEEEYERRIGTRSATSAGLSIYRIYEQLGGARNGTALELGAGGGAATIGFVQAAPSTLNVVVTDPSTSFLDLVKEKLRRESLLSANVSFATLDGEDLYKIPSNALDLIFVQSALHHVLDYRRFITDVARVLKPNGLFIAQEPFSEGCLLMELAVEFFAHMDGSQYKLSVSDRENLSRMREAMLFQSNRALPKDGYEDKHCFFTDEFLEVFHREFDRVHFLRNHSFDSLCEVADITALKQDAMKTSLIGYLRSFLSDHHQISPEGLAAFDEHVKPALVALDRLYVQGDGPAIIAVAIGQKASRRR